MVDGINALDVKDESEGLQVEELQKKEGSCEWLLETIKEEWVTFRNLINWRRWKAIGQKTQLILVKRGIKEFFDRRFLELQNHSLVLDKTSFTQIV